MGIKKEIVPLLFSLIPFLLVTCKSSSPPPSPSPPCTFEVNPSPGFFGETITVTVRGEGVRVSQVSSPLTEPPSPFPGKPYLSPPPIFSRLYEKPIVLGDGYHLLLFRDPCTRNWFTYAYWVDTIPPLLFLDPPSGFYRNPLLIQARSSEKGKIFLRVYREGSPPPPYEESTGSLYLDLEGRWVVEGYAVDPLVGNISPTTQAVYTLDFSSATLLFLRISSPIGTPTSVFPRFQIRTDIPMEQSSYLPSAFRSPGGRFPPIGAYLYWQSPTEVEGIPETLLPYGEDVELVLTGLRTTTGAGILPSPSAPTTVTFHTCSPSQCQDIVPRIYLLEGEFPTYLPPSETTSYIRFGVAPPSFPVTVFTLTALDGEAYMNQRGIPLTPFLKSPGETLREGVYEVTFPTNPLTYPSHQGKVFTLLIGVGAFPNFSQFLLTSLSVGNTQGVSPSILPSIVTVYPEPGTQSPFGEIWIQSTIPLNPESVRTGGTFVRNGNIESVLVENGGANAPTLLRIRFPTLRGGDTVAVTLPTTVTDLWGRNLSNPLSTTYTVSPYPAVSSYTVTPNRPSPGKFTVSPGQPLLGFALSPLPVSVVVDFFLEGSPFPLPNFLSVVSGNGNPFTYRGEKTRGDFLLLYPSWADSLPKGAKIRIRVTPIWNPDTPVFGTPTELTYTIGVPEDDRTSPFFPDGGGFLVATTEGTYFVNRYLFLTPRTTPTYPFFVTGQTYTGTFPLLPIPYATLRYLLVQPTSRGTPVPLYIPATSSTPYLGDFWIRFVCKDSSGTPHFDPTTDPTCLSSSGEWYQYSTDGNNWSSPRSATKDSDDLSPDLPIRIVLYGQSPTPSFTGPTETYPGDLFSFFFQANLYENHKNTDILFSLHAPDLPGGYLEGSLFYELPLPFTGSVRRYIQGVTDTELPAIVTPPAGTTFPASSTIYIRWDSSQSYDHLELIFAPVTTATLPQPFLTLWLPPNAREFFLDPNLPILPSTYFLPGRFFLWVAGMKQNFGAYNPLLSDERWLQGVGLSAPSGITWGP